MAASSLSSAIRVEFDSALFSAETIQKAALKFTDVCSFDLRVEAPRIVALVSPLSDAYDLAAEEFVSRFRNEVLDQNLRDIVRRETEAERNLILAYAFSNTKLIDS